MPVCISWSNLLSVGTQLLGATAFLVLAHPVRNCNRWANLLLLFQSLTDQQYWLSGQSLV